ncbi:T9SS type B sorting domain-containing protein [Nonlabens tegetincola]|uniref:T9SS type B sorting domain-containing protein n=1 Tax=Nonlabens tegetincola TaxID=323273 RepID=UPI000CF4D1CD|nr:T9SS type B sorting domain-containing protein [Nonlabens tegetincola]PQJ17185.1 hypothetical protein BST93_11055 [Nonlabens tegetincola]
MKSTIISIIFLTILQNTLFSQNFQCEANFQPSLINADIGEQVDFTNTSHQSDSFQWLFGPGSTPQSSSLENPVVSFNQIGTRSSTLSITSNRGCSDTITIDGPNVEPVRNSISDCWTMIQKGPDLYNGQSGFFGNGSSLFEVTDIEELNDGFLTTGHFHDHIINSRFGITYNETLGLNGSYLTKYDKNGMLKWLVLLENDNTTQRSSFISTVQDLNGDIYIAGNSQGGFFKDNYGNTIDLTVNRAYTRGFIIKLDSKGKLIWHRRGESIYPQKVIIDNNNNLVVMGDLRSNGNAPHNYNWFINNTTLSSFDDFGRIDMNHFLSKFDSNGNLIWNANLKLTGPNSNRLKDVIIDSNNNIYLAGYFGNDLIYYSANGSSPSVTNFPGNLTKSFLLKYDSNGQVIWVVNTFVEDNNDFETVRVKALELDNSGNVYMTGQNRCIYSHHRHVFENTDGTRTSEKVGGYYLAKINSSGICEWIVGVDDSYFGYGHDLISDNNEILVLAQTSDNRLSHQNLNFTSTNGNNLNTTIGNDDLMVIAYTEQGVLKRMVKSGNSRQDYLAGDSVKSFFKDDDDNYYLARVIGHMGGNFTTPYQFFGTTILQSDLISRDATITKFNENCGDIIYNSINQNVVNLQVCDNITVGNNYDGLVIIDLTSHESNIVTNNSQNNLQFQYFLDSNFTIPINDPLNYQNTLPLETIYVHVTDSNNSSFNGSTTFQLEIIALPVVNSPVSLLQCDDDTDGISLFNLNEAAPSITPDLITNTITYFTSAVDAAANTNAIVNPINYQNSTASSDTIYARVSNTNGCFDVAQVNLQVTTTALPAGFNRSIYECDDGTDLYDGVASFDFSTVTTDIINQFPTGQALDVTYYPSENDALAESNEITNITNYQNTTSPQTIYVRVESSLNNDCLALGPYLTLYTENNPLDPGVLTITQCDQGNDGVETIDTSNIAAQLLQGQTGVGIEYRDSTGNLLPNPLPNPLVTGTQTINVRLFNTTSQDTDGACELFTTIDIVVDAGVSAFSVPAQEVCDTDADGLFDFDTSSIQSTILGNQSGVQITYEDQNGNALPSPLPNPFTTATQAVTATVINPLNPQCFEQITINFVVYETPVAHPVQDDIVCDDFSNDGSEVFDLTVYNSQVLLGQNPTDFSISYHSSLSNAQSNNNALPFSYTSSVTSETVFVRIENNLNPNCYNVTDFEIGVSRQPIATMPPRIEFCDDTLNDGVVSLNLGDQNTAILNGQLPNENRITYHSSLSDAENNLNALPNAYTTVQNPETVFVRIENVDHPDCADFTQFEIEVYEQPVLNMPTQWTICENGTVDILAPTGYDSYLWSTNESTSTITVDTPGSYTLEVANDYGTLFCEDSIQIEVIESTIPVITDIEVSDWSRDNNSITVTVTGTGDYEYSIDGITFQSSNSFTNLIFDDYVVYVRDRNGCGQVSQEVFLLFYPNFFTPNSDGFNDYWQLYNASIEPSAKIYIFDRYGKLLKQILPQTVGWDGTFNGNPMPSSDYWFTVERADGRTLSGHFSLKR